MKTDRIFAGNIEEGEKERWIRQMQQDGFTSLWTWICWVIRQHIRVQQHTMKHENIFEDAVQAYHDFCESHGYVFQQPSQSDSVVGRKYVHLKNVNGKLAKYVIATGEIIE